MHNISRENIVKYKNEIKEISKMRPIDTSFTPRPSHFENINPN